MTRFKLFLTGLIIASVPVLVWLATTTQSNPNDLVSVRLPELPVRPLTADFEITLQIATHGNHDVRIIGGNWC